MILIFASGIFFAQLVVDLNHLAKAAFAIGQHDHVGQKKRERIFACDIVRAPNRMAKAKRFLLAGEARCARCGQKAFEVQEFFLLVAAPQHFLKLELPVEMVFDNAFIAARYKDEMLDAAVPRLVDHMLNDWPVYDGQHFFRHGLGGRKKPRARGLRRGKWLCE